MKTPYWLWLVLFFLFHLLVFHHLWVFFQKYRFFFFIVLNSFYFFSFLIICISMISAFYYLRIINIVMFSKVSIGWGGSYTSKNSFISWLGQGLSYLLSFFIQIILFFCLSPSLLILITHRIAVVFIILCFLF